MTQKIQLIKYKAVLVTPELAAEWLKKNTINQRDYKSRIANSYANLMIRGEFSQSSPIPISFDENGNLFDGQHRLNAVIISGKSIWMMIAENVPSENFKYVDKGSKRSSGDIFKISGIENSKLCSAIIQKYLFIAKLPGKKVAGTSSSDNYHMTSIDDLLSTYNNKKDYWQHVVEFANKSHKSFGTFLSPSFFGAWYASCCDISQQEALTYFNALTTGVGFTSDKDPILQFRNYLIKTKETKNNVLASTRYALFIKSWNMYRTNTVKTLTFQPSNEKFPVLK